MSLIYANGQYSKYGEVFCEKCGAWCFAEEWSVISDMALREVHVLCWGCDPESSDSIPAHFYYLDETFLLGVGGGELSRPLEN